MEETKVKISQRLTIQWATKRCRRRSRGSERWWSSGRCRGGCTAGCGRGCRTWSDAAPKSIMIQQNIGKNIFFFQDLTLTRVTLAWLRFYLFSDNFWGSARPQYFFNPGSILLPYFQEKNIWMQLESNLGSLARRWRSKQPFYTINQLALWHNRGYLNNQCRQKFDNIFY